MTRNKPVLYCDDGSEIELPTKWVICSHCRGEGKSSAYLGAYTRDEMDEQGPEFLEDYLAGVYDRACNDCGGAGKVRVADYSKMTRAQRAEFEAQLEGEREMGAIQAAERRMGA